MAPFGFGRPRTDALDRSRIAEWTREDGAYGEGVVVKVNEIVCFDPACPGSETVILTMAAGRPTRAFKIAKPLSLVTQQDVAEALTASG